MCEAVYKEKHIKGAGIMGLWEAFALVAVIAILTQFVLRLVKIGTRYCENIERIKRGYPTIDDSKPIRAEEAEPVEHGVRLQ